MFTKCLLQIGAKFFHQIMYENFQSSLVNTCIKSNITYATSQLDNPQGAVLV